MMLPSRQLCFGDFRLEASNARLWRGGRQVSLQPKALTVLEYLVERAGRLVSKDELLAAGWPGVFVGDAALKVCVREIRRALEDDAAAPRYIETVHRRGYRFRADVEVVDPGAADAAPAAASVARPAKDLPITRYANSRGVNIAYQVIGEGARDIVFVMGWVSHLDYFWAEPSFAAFLHRLASFGRLILFDKRGTGLSDPVAALPTLEQRMDDVRAVMEAAGSRDAVLFGVSEGGPMCALFAATYPERTRGLVMFGTYARRLRDPDYPWGPTPAERERFLDEIREHWGGPVGIDVRAPSRAHDPAFRAWWATYLRMGASPGTAVALTQMNGEVDVRHVLPTVRVPTLVLHRRGDRCLLLEEGRYVASRIQGAEFIELDGDDHLPFVGDQAQVLDCVERFVQDLDHRPGDERVLATVLVAVVPDGTQAPVVAEHAVRLLQGLPGAARVEATSHGVQATFDGPARAIGAARALLAAADLQHAQLAVGLHTGECRLAPAGAVDGTAVAIARDVAARARPGEALASRTLRDLVAGSGVRFADRGEHALGPIGERWHLYAV